jgi:hypothetical protein
VESVRIAQPEDAANNASYSSGTLDLTVYAFLSLRSIRAWNSMDGSDIDSVNSVTADHLRRITVPLLIVTSGGQYFIRDNENHYEFAASADKDFVLQKALHILVHLACLANSSPANMPIQPQTR